ncbi:bifunctional adenosylcobinamide kinase/adenosylcobinamide-phosphate guanylyltransferase [Thalassotalea fusca]
MHFIIGGARSGKSNFAEQQVQKIVQQTDQTPIYLATGIAIDDEMTDRITRHQLQRSQASAMMNKPWQLHECAMQIATACQQFGHEHVVLLDCLSLWLNNHIFYAVQQFSSDDEVQTYLSDMRQQLVQALQNTTCRLVIVSNEVGLGIVPLGRETRWFVDHLGWLNQAIAQIADEVTLLTAGLPMTLKTNDRV